MRTSNSSVLVVLLSALTLTASGCALLDGVTNGSAENPTLQYQETRLVQSPTANTLLAYYCPSTGFGSACSAAFGAAPAKENLRFDFEVGMLANNTNSFPIPTLSMLLATTLYPDDPDIQELGATCVQFCDPGDASCTGQGAEDACAAGDQRDIDSFDDFVDSATDQLIGVATGDIDPNYGDNLGIRTIPAHGSSDLNVAFSFGIDPMTDILGRVATDAVSAWIQGNEAPFEIPFSVRGTLWVNIPLGLGRVGLPFGPAASSWQID